MKIKNKKEKRKILFLSCFSFVLGDIINACKKQDIEYIFHQMPESGTVEEILKEVKNIISSFNPSFVFTVNHLGVDKEGYMLDLFEQLDIAFVSWFVDNPRLILGSYKKIKTKRTLIATWDRGNIAYLKEECAFENVMHLPLGVDFERLSLASKKKEWQNNVSFVGTSMSGKVASRLACAGVSVKDLSVFPAIVAVYMEKKEQDFKKLLKNFPEIETTVSKLSGAEQGAFLTAIMHQATLQYRLQCVLELVPLRGHIFGDSGWKELLPKTDLWTYHPPVNYYEDLPSVYASSIITFNTTSQQMISAVNQRIFDAPVAGSFLISDFSEELGEYLEIGKEVIVYKHHEEIPDLVKWWLRNHSGREKVILAAKKRIFAEHRYELRLETLLMEFERTCQ